MVEGEVVQVKRYSAPEFNKVIFIQTEGEDFPASPEPEPPEPRRARIQVKLADGKARQLQGVMDTPLWSADGKPMSAAQLLESLIGALPECSRTSCRRC